VGAAWSAAAANFENPGIPLAAGLTGQPDAIDTIQTCIFELLVLLVPIGPPISHNGFQGCRRSHNVIARRNGPVGANIGSAVSDDDDDGDITELVSPLSGIAIVAGRIHIMQCMHRVRLQQQII
jgi:hypothetical protein